MIYATYVMKTIASSDSWIPMDGICSMTRKSLTLITLLRPLGSFSTICQLKFHLDLQAIDTLRDQ
jgi:hypothetical protein